MITLRLDLELEKSVEYTAKSVGLSKSELVRNSIIDYLSKFKKADYWNSGKDLFGKHSSQKGTLSVNANKLFKDKLKSKFK